MINFLITFLINKIFKNLLFFLLLKNCPAIFENENKTAILHPETSFGTGAIAGTKALKQTTIAYWEIHVPGLFGSSMMFGIGRRSTKFHFVISFDNLLGGGSNKSFEKKCDNFGLAHSGLLYGGRFNGRFNHFPRKYCDEMANHPTNIGVLFHGPEGWLAYFIDGKPMGYAFTDIDATADFYYPMISRFNLKKLIFYNKIILALLSVHNLL